MRERQESKRFTDFIARDLADLPEHVVAVQSASQPEMDMPVWGVLGLPYPRIEITVGGGEVVVRLTVGPGQIFVLADFTRLAQCAG